MGVVFLLYLCGQSFVNLFSIYERFFCREFTFRGDMGVRAIVCGELFCFAEYYLCGEGKELDG